MQKEMTPYKEHESTALEWLESIENSLHIVEYGTTKKMREIGIRSIRHSVKKAIEFIKEDRNVK